MLNWILDDPDMKEVFRNSSIIGNSLHQSTDFGLHSSSRAPKPLEEKKKSTEMEASNTSLSKLFSDEEERDLLGIGFFTIYEAGLLVSGYAGTGIVLSRNIMTGKWSGPVAVMLSGIGAGVLLGASVKTVVYLIYDYFTLKSISGTEGGVIFGAGTEATIGTWTTETGKQTSYITSAKTFRTAGIGTNVALCRGLAGIYGAMSVEAGFCKCRDKINARFYGRDDISGSDILLSGEPIDIPNNAIGVSNYQAKRFLEKIHSKLERLCDPEGSDHGSKIYNHSTNDIGYNKSSDEFSVSDTDMKAEDIQATLEQLYADETYDRDDSEQKEIDLIKTVETTEEDPLRVTKEAQLAKTTISAQS